MTTVPDRVDRPVSFAYNYRMRCGCGGVEDLSAVDYEAEINEAHIPCSRCGGSIHFGRRVAALRDLNDSALENEQLSRLAWYHTSTSPDWPSLTYEVQQRERLRDFGPVTDEQIAMLSGLALHVGTYEAAIENVLRRMKNQDDRDSRFFLYRVALNLDPTRVETGYRDENEQRAARLSKAELRDEGLQAVRYLNVYESPGSLSLAVTADAIAAVQMVDLDGHGLVPDHDAELTERLDSFQRDLDVDRLRPLPPPREPIWPWKSCGGAPRPGADRPSTLAGQLDRSSTDCGNRSTRSWPSAISWGSTPSWLGSSATPSGHGDEMTTEPCARTPTSTPPARSR